MNVRSIQSIEVAAASLPTQEAAARRQLIKAVDLVNNSQTLGSENVLVFIFDRTTHRPILRVVDRKTNDIIMQLPPEYVLNLAAGILAHERSSAT